jgi:RNA polymerase sigma factor (sigma-70 family)
MNDDLDAIRWVLAADVESFRCLLERYQRALLTLIRNLTPPDTDHEGVAQEVFLAAFRSLASFDPKRSAFSTWLFTIARNRCRNELARRRPVVGAELPDVVDLRSPERAASEAEGEGAGRDVFRAGRQPEQFARQPHDRLRGPWRRARRRTVQVLASRDVDPVRRPHRISTNLIPIMNPPLNGTSDPCMVVSVLFDLDSSSDFGNSATRVSVMPRRETTVLSRFGGRLVHSGVLPGLVGQLV